MSHKITIKENAIFIADAHHNSLYQNTLDVFLEKLLNTDARQIFFMGDVFDFLVGPATQSLKDNQYTLELFEKLALKHEIYYFEGNHDFLLKKIAYFKNITYFPLKEQPICFSLNNKDTYLAHGDIFLSWHYNFFSYFFRQKLLIIFLNLFSFILYPKIINYLIQKNIAKNTHNNTNNADNFNNFAKHRIQKYSQKIKNKNPFFIIEGHFHLGKSAIINEINYIGLPFFACKKKYFVVKYEDNCLVLKECQGV